MGHVARSASGIGADLLHRDRLEAQLEGGRLGPQPVIVLVGIDKQRIGHQRVPVLARGLPRLPLVQRRGDAERHVVDPQRPVRLDQSIRGRTSFNWAWYPFSPTAGRRKASWYSCH